MTEVRGTYERCAGCKAPAVMPFPVTWAIDLIKRGQPHGLVRVSFMPHRPGCIMQPMRFAPGEGVSVRIPGRAIPAFGFDLDRDHWAD